jgi:hypothetical protein
MKCNKELYNSVGCVHILNPVSASAGVTKTALVDTTGLQGVLFVASIGVYTVGSGTGVTWKLVEGSTSADNALTDVASADYAASSLTLCTDADDDLNTQYIEYKGTAKYVGANITVTTNSTSALISCVAITHNHESEPVTAQTATART